MDKELMNNGLAACLKDPVELQSGGLSQGAFLISVAIIVIPAALIASSLFTGTQFWNVWLAPALTAWYWIFSISPVKSHRVFAAPQS